MLTMISMLAGFFTVVLALGKVFRLWFELKRTLETIIQSQETFSTEQEELKEKLQKFHKQLEQVLRFLEPRETHEKKVLSALFDTLSTFYPEKKEDTKQ